MSVKTAEPDSARTAGVGRADASPRTGSAPSRARPRGEILSRSSVPEREIEAAGRRLEADNVAVEAMLDLCWEVEDQGNTQESAALSIAGARRAEALGRIDVALDLRANAIRKLHALGDLRGAVDYGAKSMRWMRQVDDVLPKVRLLTVLGLAYAGLERIDRAIECLRRAQALPIATSPVAAYLLAIKSGETLMLFGREAEAAAEYRKAYAILKRLPGADADAYRQGYTRITLAQTLLMAAIKDARPLDAAEIHTLLDASHRPVECVAVLRVPYLAVRGLAMAVTGDHGKDWVEDFLALPQNEILVEEGWSQAAVCAWATLEATQHGRLAVARSLLDRIDPADAVLAWPSWAASWHRAYAEVHAAAGDHKAAVDAYRAFATVDQRARERHVTLAFEMADRASRADEIQQRRREASNRAERLARRNSALAAEKAQLAETVLTDALTGIGNRRALELRIAALRARKRSKTCTVVIGDVDHFKAINDTFSHQIGDKVLAVIGSLLGRSARDQDCIARWGGEEFVLLFHNPVGLRRIDGIRKTVETFDWSAIDPNLRVTISFGAALWPTSTDFTVALSLADERLYAAKRSGRNRVIMEPSGA